MSKNGDAQNDGAPERPALTRVEALLREGKTHEALALHEKQAAEMRAQMQADGEKARAAVNARREAEAVERRATAAQQITIPEKENTSPTNVGSTTPPAKKWAKVETGRKAASSASFDAATIDAPNAPQKPLSIADRNTQMGIK